MPTRRITSVLALSAVGQTFSLCTPDTSGGTARLPVVPQEHHFLSALDGLPFAAVAESVGAAAGSGP